jgi:hypothetical protein
VGAAFEPYEFSDWYRAWAKRPCKTILAPCGNWKRADQ